MGTDIRVTTESRWDALELMDALTRYHPFLVQMTPSRWELRAHSTADEPTIVADLRLAVERALERRSLDRVDVFLGGGRTITILRPVRETSERQA